MHTQGTQIKNSYFANNYLAGLQKNPLQPVRAVINTGAKEHVVDIAKKFGSLRTKFGTDTKKVQAAIERLTSQLNNLASTSLNRSALAEKKVVEQTRKSHGDTLYTHDPNQQSITELTAELNLLLEYHDHINRKEIQKYPEILDKISQNPQITCILESKDDGTGTNTVVIKRKNLGKVKEEGDTASEPFSDPRDINVFTDGGLGGWVSDRPYGTPAKLQHMDSTENRMPTTTKVDSSEVVTSSKFGSFFRDLLFGS